MADDLRERAEHLLMLSQKGLLNIRDLETALRAVQREAIEAAGSNMLPAFTLDDDCLTIWWQKLGVCLIVEGEKINPSAKYAIKRGNGFYADHVRPFDLRERAPEEFATAIRALVPK